MVFYLQNMSQSGKNGQAGSNSMPPNNGKVKPGSSGADDAEPKRPGESHESTSILAEDYHEESMEAPVCMAFSQAC